MCEVVVVVVVVGATLIFGDSSVLLKEIVFNFELLAK